MPSRSNPASMVVNYFESVPIETAAVVLEICKEHREAPHRATGRVRKPSAKAARAPAPAARRAR